MALFNRINITLLLILCSLTAYSQPNKFEFQRYYAEQGLSHNYVLSIAQDDLGFMWFGTEDGLNRFDGINFKTYRYVPGDPNSLPHNVVRTITFDQEGNMWLGGDQVIKFDIKKEKFISLSSMMKDYRDFSDGTIEEIIVDHTGKIWTLGRPELKFFHLFCFDPEKDRCAEFKHEPNNPLSISNDTVNDIALDNTNNIWVGTKKSLQRYSRKEKGFITYPQKKENIDKIKPGVVKKICPDPEGGIWFVIQEPFVQKDQIKQHTHLYYLRIIDGKEQLGVYPNLNIKYTLAAITVDFKERVWFATGDYGIFLFHSATKKLQQFKYNPSEQNSISNNGVYDIFIDRTKVLWIATHNGLNKLDLYKKLFRNYTQNPAKPNNSLGSNLVNCIYKDDHNALWIGTQDAGITKIKRYKNKPDHYTFYKQKENRPHILVSNVVNFINGDRQGNIWFGGVAINKLNTKTGRFSYYHPDHDNPYTIKGWIYWSMDIGPDGDIWFGGLEGVCKLLDKDDAEYKPGKTRFMPLKNIKWNRYWTLHEDHNNVLWIGCGSGLIKYNTKTRDIKHYPSNTDSTFDEAVVYIHEDENNNLWLGTEGGGLHLFNKNTGKCTHYYKRDGLPSNTVWGILDDEQGNLWLSTNNGISKFNPVTKKFINYYKSDGIQGNIFRVGACHKSEDGELFFGGTNGITSFYPDIIHDNPYLPQVVITKFYLANQPVKINHVYQKDTILNQSVSHTEEIFLHHTNKDFTIEFAALHFAAPQENLYEYILEGYDKQWKKTNAVRRYATYTNMPSGDYTFKVKASNNDEVWNHMG
ncbi:MAG: hypothetical protein GF350_16420, partial [Chitinivibrionales bacterium]|nr:hypothetical protein [Chitinivibrionales bacterium]